MTSTSEAPASPATSATTNDVPAFGWSGYAERVNNFLPRWAYLSVAKTF